MKVFLLMSLLVVAANAESKQPEALQLQAEHRSAKPEPFIDTLTELLFGSDKKQAGKKKGGSKRPIGGGGGGYQRPQSPQPSYNTPVVAARPPKPQYGPPKIKPQYGAPSINSGYGAPKAPAINSGYGAPQAPVVSSYNPPQGGGRPRPPVKGPNPPPPQVHQNRPQPPPIKQPSQGYTPAASNNFASVFGGNNGGHGKSNILRELVQYDIFYSPSSPTPKKVVILPDTQVSWFRCYRRRRFHHFWQGKKSCSIMQLSSLKKVTLLYAIY